jgi:hypothetical protein
LHRGQLNLGRASLIMAKVEDPAPSPSASHFASEFGGRAYQGTNMIINSLVGKECE